jgi:hypothetical protein
VNNELVHGSRVTIQEINLFKFVISKCFQYGHSKALDDGKNELMMNCEGFGRKRSWHI